MDQFLFVFFLLFFRDLHIHSQIKRRKNNRNNKNNHYQASLMSLDAAECIDSDIDFVAGLHIHLAKGYLILNDDDAQMVSYTDIKEISKTNIFLVAQFNEYL